MKKQLQTQFLTRQYMLAKDFEIYYYKDLVPTKVALHAHDYYEFYFFIEGDVSIQIGQTLYPVTYGDMMLIPPHVRHRPCFHDTNVPYRRFVFWISQEYCKHLAELSPDYMYLFEYVSAGKNYLFHCDRISFNAVQSRILGLIEEMRSNRFGKNAQITLSVNDLILHLNRMVHERLEPVAQPDISLYQNLCNYINEHLDENLSLDNLAAEFFLSKYHIAHIFKEHTGLSVHQYITKKRLALCREALLGNSSITDACHSCGFSDYSAFYRAFKKEYGISPKDWLRSFPELPL